MLSRYPGDYYDPHRIFHILLKRVCGFFFDFTEETWALDNIVLPNPNPCFQHRMHVESSMKREKNETYTTNISTKSKWTATHVVLIGQECKRISERIHIANM